MSGFEDYSPIIKYNGEDLIVYLDIKIEGTLYYICENYRVFKKVMEDFEEVKDKKILKQVNNMITLKKE